MFFPGYPSLHLLSLLPLSPFHQPYSSSPLLSFPLSLSFNPNNRSSHPVAPRKWLQIFSPLARSPSQPSNQRTKWFETELSDRRNTYQEKNLFFFFKKKALVGMYKSGVLGYLCLSREDHLDRQRSS